MWNGLSGLAETIAAETRPGDLVGIALPTCSMFPLAMLACLAAGRPFVALDPHYPDNWLRQVLEDARPALIIGREDCLRNIESVASTTRVIRLNRLPEAAQKSWRPTELALDQPACVVFTSGSTGRPKGIVNSQRNLLQRVAQSVNAAHVNAEDRFLTLASLCTIVGVRDAMTALLYEMVTGQRAFRGNSRISTLAAIVEKEPQPPGEIMPDVPPELERAIARCLRKDVHRRSQNMADVKLALEELRDESESGKLMRSPAATPGLGGGRRFLWPIVAVTSVFIAATAVGWTWVNRRAGMTLHGPNLERLTPDDGHSYLQPAISSDGKFVAYLSDRSGKEELWLQQIGSREPIQLTHSSERVISPAFFTDGTRILYSTGSRDRRTGTIETIPTLGGQPQVLATTVSFGPSFLSPDGHHVAYYDGDETSRHLMLVPSDGGTPRELSNWTKTQGRLRFAVTHGHPTTVISSVLAPSGRKPRPSTNGSGLSCRRMGAHR